MDKEYLATTSASQMAGIHSFSSVVPEQLIGKDEEIIFAIKPSMWFVLFNSGRMILFVLIVVFLSRIFTYSAGYFWHQRIYQVAVLIVIARLVASFFQWLSRLYILTNRRVLRIRGVFNIDIFEAPLNKIQNTYLTFGFHERIVGLGSIHFETAGSSAIEASWININQPLKIHKIVVDTIQRAQRTGQGEI